jgi:flagellar export protein FliJ
MKFRFRLANILRLRRFHEERELAELQRLHAQESAAHQKELHIHHLSIDSRNESGLAHNNVCTAADLQFLQQCLTALDVAAVNAKTSLANARQAVEQQQLVSHRARRDAEILEALREKEAVAYLYLEARRTQQQLDEAYALIRSSKTGQASLVDTAELARSPYTER